MGQESNIARENSKGQIPSPKKGNADGETSQHLPEDSAAPIPEITDQKQATQNMETHAHHFHKAPSHGWKHYIFEFLMLFFAVFCGFLAENFREHRVEQERGRQYLHSLIQDLKNDTTQCCASIDELDQDEIILSNLTNCFVILQQNTRSTSCLREIISHSLGFKDFIYSDRTIQQLKNAGGLRLIQNKEIADSIAAYDAAVREMLIHQSVLENLQQISKNAHNGMIDFIHLSDLRRSSPTDSLHLLSSNPERT